ncbi:MAG: DUF4229 domain-containing protein [Nocardioides sp.]
MKDFWLYTALRVGIFAGSFAIVAGLWALISGRNQVPVLGALLISLVASGIASYWLLGRQREALARHVEARARAASSKFEELKAKEDEV